MLPEDHAYGWWRQAVGVPCGGDPEYSGAFLLSLRRVMSNGNHLTGPAGTSVRMLSISCFSRPPVLSD